MRYHVDKHLKLDKPLGLNLISMEPRPIKVTNLADRTTSGAEKAIENAKTGKVTAVIAVMYLNEKCKINSHNANLQKSEMLIGTEGSTICPTSEIVCLPVLIFTYSHVENALFFALDLVVFCNSNYFFKNTNWYTITCTSFSNIPIGIL